MGESTIGWLHPPRAGRAPFGAPGLPGYTVNYWIGCTKVDPECANCYAAREANRRMLPTFRDRSLPVWGPKAPRHMTSEQTLRRVHAWHREAEAEALRRLIFGGSQCDWLEDRPDLVGRRETLMETVEATPWLRWILLTKRPQNFRRLAARWAERCPDNAWIGISAGSQRSLERKLDAFAAIPAAVKVISGEPLLERVDFRRGLEVATWILFGGENASRDLVRECDVRWIGDGVDQATEAGRAKFVKQLGTWPVEGNVPLAARPGFRGKADDPTFWPAELRVQEWPDGAAYLPVEGAR